VDPFFILVSDFATEIAFISFFFYHQCEWKFSWQKSNFCANIAKIVWVVYTVSWHSIGNVTHFKEITSLKQTNLQVVSLTSFFYISLMSANFCFTSCHRQPPHNWHCASVTQQTSLLNIWKHSGDTCIPSQVTISRIKPHFMYHDN
jgi:hypothetical protein